MSKSTAGRALRRRQLDRLFLEPISLRAAPQFRRGWIREIREALGMSAAQLAARLGVSQPTVAKMEKAEAAGTVGLPSLRRAAEALGCRLVYAFVPETSLEARLTAQAEEVARRLVGRVAHTMRLEAQGGTSAEEQAQIAALAAELVRTLSRELWNEEVNEG